MSDDNPQTTETVALADLNPERVRAENDYVDEKIAGLESKVSDLQEAKAELSAENEDLSETVEDFESEKEAALEDQAEDYEAQIDELEAELETKNEIIEDIRESQKAELVEDLRETKAAATGQPVDEVDVSKFEEASRETIESTIETLEEVAESAGRAPVESTEEDIEPQAASTGGTSEKDKQRVAREMGVDDLLEDADNLAPQGFTTTGDS